MQAKTVVKNVENCVIAYALDNCKCPHTNLVVIGHIGCDRGDKRLNPFGFLCVKVALIISVFPILHMLQTIVQ